MTEEEEQYTKEAREIFEGHSIVLAYQEGDTGFLVLDDGSEVEVQPNTGCGGCSAGWSEITDLATCPNIITRAEVDINYGSETEYYDDDQSYYELYVFADNQEINILSVDGNDGNGYYGSGYTLIVREAKPDA